MVGVDTILTNVFAKRNQTMNDCVLIYLRRVSNGFTITVVPEHEPRKVRRYVAECAEHSYGSQASVTAVVSKIAESLENPNAESND